ncbi:MAG: hypothetical protein ACWGQW_02275 [bacterium]
MPKLVVAFKRPDDTGVQIHEYDGAHAVKIQEGGISVLELEGSLVAYYPNRSLVYVSVDDV